MCTDVVSLHECHEHVAGYSYLRICLSAKIRAQLSMVRLKFGEIVLILFHVLLQLLFTISKMKLDYHKVNVRVSLGCVEPLGNLRKTSQMLRITELQTKSQPVNSNESFDSSARKSKKSAIKLSTGSLILPDPVNLAQISSQ